MPRGPGQGNSDTGSGRGLGGGSGADTGRGQRRGRMGGQSIGAGGSCVCPGCGTRAEHVRGKPCYEMMCPKCGTQMIRE